MLAPETSLLPTPLPTAPTPPPTSLSPSSTCKFNSCDKPSVPGTDKCSFHKNRPHCSFADCNNQVVSQRLCARHGGKKVCQFDGCTAHTRGRKFCLTHGGVVPKRFCSVEGCNKQAHSNQKCVRHGGGRYCKAVGCSYHARSGGFCRMHRSPSSGAASQMSDDTVAPSRNHPSRSPSSSDDDGDDRSNDTNTQRVPPLESTSVNAAALLVNTHYLPREKPDVPYVRRPQVELKPRPPPPTMMPLHLPPPLAPPPPTNVTIQPAPAPSQALTASADGTFPPDRTLMSMANLVHAMTRAPSHVPTILPSAATSLLPPDSSAPKCKFNLCVNQTVAGSDKCAFHKNRTNCSFPDCTNQVVARNLCVRHGGRRLCQFEDCTAHRRGKKFCLKHGGEVPKRFCTVDGCKKQAHSNQRCVRHGGGRYCQSPGCSYHARTGGFCRNHAAGGDAPDDDDKEETHRHTFDGLLMLQMCATGDVELGGPRVKQE